MNSINEHPTRLRKKIIPNEPVRDNREKNRSIKKVSVILKKAEGDRTAEETEYLFKYSEIAKEAASRLEKREQLKQREKEFEDSEATLDEKCLQLAEAVSRAKYLIVYTGAGISTAACIPDYRGTSGIWTLLQQGKDIGEHDLTQAEPTYTHMALAEMYKQGRLKHVVSQNCDGLHLRSGLTKRALSELHGNMYIEVCRSCRPIREYLRLFDVTENTARFSHRTYRRCYHCQSPLTDSIVHFGERGNLPWPLNWKGACRAAEKADVILCMGSSLKVLKRYPWLWSMDRPAKRRPKLYIVNLQWTPKDCQAAMKIHGKCDAVMKRITKFLGIEVPEYKKEKDPIFWHATLLCDEEKHTTNRSCLEPAAEELIVITVASDPKACCTKHEQGHDDSCQNFGNAVNDVPIILENDKIVATGVASAPPIHHSFSLIETMFFNYLYSLISSLTSLHCPQPCLPMPSTSNILQIAPPPPPSSPPPSAKVIKKESSSSPTASSAKKPRLTSSTILCSFCDQQYSSDSCLFYEKFEPLFKPDISVCLCCDDDDDEDGDGEIEDDKEKPTEDIVEKPVEALKATSNPGWYGKGYKKKVKKKR